MLKRLFIQNYALIEKLEVTFDKGMNVITGETGSGKSIIIDAFSMLLGERSDTEVLKNKTEKCIIEGEFGVAEYDLKEFFANHEIDYSDIALLRREINPQGKSRAFINDTPVNLTVLKELGEFLVDIHSQHENLSLGKAINRFETLDAFSGISSRVGVYRETFKQVKKSQAELAELEEQERKSKLDLDYFQFQFNELTEAAVKENENISAEQELEILNHAEEIKTALDQCIKIIESENEGILRQSREIKSLLSKIAVYDEKTGKLTERVESLIIELNDISGELVSMNDKIVHDPQRAEMLNQRLDVLNGLLFKHRVKTTAELIDLRNDFEAKIHSVSSLGDRIETFKKQLQAIFEKAVKQADAISTERKKSIPVLEKETADILKQLAMPHAELRIDLQKTEELTINGNDTLSFLFRANKGGEPKELSKVASGGEFSRLMLALKSIITAKKTLPTIIFDEIDTGVSGEVAHKMGSIMQQMGKQMQVFCITHLPQVAVKGNAHYKVIKQISKKDTVTVIEKLEEKSRVEEIAKMLSGEKLTDAALANAKELIRTK